ncbi:translation elongation factor Ts [Aquipuribacter nitratireducens]|uniref:Elongation factor Ts n=1 Tax=Aquipuribacter nitratireducens TaxID=650104 RepID=A0ABW0GKI2_9MICO
MPSYTAADIKALRERTGAGMLDVKKALDEAEGDTAKAVDILRVKGLKGVTKREGRSASNGLVAAHVEGGTGVLVEVNCETDFVAKGETFQALAQQVLDAAVSSGAADAEALASVDAGDGRTVQQLLDDGNATIGEKLVLRRVARVEGDQVASYLHRTSPDLPPQIGVLVAFSGDDAATARDVALHTAAMSPRYLTTDEVPEEQLEAERRIAHETAVNEGKPEQALPKIVEGRLKGYLKENVLLEQAFSKDNKKSVGQVLSEAGLSVSAFARFRVGA